MEVETSRWRGPRCVPVEKLTYSPVSWPMQTHRPSLPSHENGRESVKPWSCLVLSMKWLRNHWFELRRWTFLLRTLRAWTEVKFNHRKHKGCIFRTPACWLVKPYSVHHSIEIMYIQHRKSPYGLLVMFSNGKCSILGLGWWAWFSIPHFTFPVQTQLLEKPFTLNWI